MISAEHPFLRMSHDTGAHHIQVDVDHASQKVIPALDSRGVIPVFPERPMPLLPVVVFLSRAARRQLQAAGDRIGLTLVDHEQMDVIGGDHVIQEMQTLLTARLFQPIQISSSISIESQQEILLVAPMRDVPNLARQIASIRSRHKHLFYS